MSVIFHLSDTHFGTEQQDVITALLRLVREETPDIVIHSGDITQRARRSQFRAAAEFMELLEVRQRVVLPGNHDIPLYNVAARIFTPYGNHLRAFGAELEPELESPDALIIGVNTTSPLRHKDGKVSEYQITRVSRRLCSAKEEQLRIVVTHQPVLVIRPRDEANLLHGHREAVYAWANAGADLILGGAYPPALCPFSAGAIRRSAAHRMGRSGRHGGIVARSRKYTELSKRYTVYTIERSAALFNRTVGS